MNSRDFYRCRIVVSFEPEFPVLNPHWLGGKNFACQLIPVVTINPPGVSRVDGITPEFLKAFGNTWRIRRFNPIVPWVKTSRTT